MNCFRISFMESDLSWDNHSMSESSILNYDYNDGYSLTAERNKVRMLLNCQIHYGVSPMTLKCCETIVET